MVLNEAAAKRYDLLVSEYRGVVETISQLDENDLDALIPHYKTQLILSNQILKLISSYPDDFNDNTKNYWASENKRISTVYNLFSEKLSNSFGGRNDSIKNSSESRKSDVGSIGFDDEINKKLDSFEYDGVKSWNNIPKYRPIKKAGIEGGIFSRFKRKSKPRGEGICPNCGTKLKEVNTGSPEEPVIRLYCPKCQRYADTFSSADDGYRKRFSKWMGRREDDANVSLEWNKSEVGVRKDYMDKYRSEKGNKLLGYYQGAKSGGGGWIRNRREKWFGDESWSQKKTRYGSWLRFLFVTLFFIAMLNFAASGSLPISFWQMGVLSIAAFLVGLLKQFEPEEEDSSKKAANQKDKADLVSIIVFLAVLIASAINFSFLGTVLCIIIGGYIYLDFKTDSFMLSLIMMLFLGIVAFLVYSGWGDIISVQADAVASQLGFGDALDTSMTSAKSGLSTIWLILTDPNEWYAQKAMTENTEVDEGLTTRAVEISSTTVNPSSVLPGDSFKVKTEVKNFVDYESGAVAETVYVFVERDDGGFLTFGDSCDPVSYFEYFDPTWIDEQGHDTNYCMYAMDNLNPMQSARYIFDMNVPDYCVGSFKFKTGVLYTYSVDAYSDFDIIGEDAYNTLVEQGNLKNTETSTVRGAGPLSVSLTTLSDPPVPVKKGEEFMLYLSFFKEDSTSSKIKIAYVTIDIPDDLQIVDDECDFVEYSTGSQDSQSVFGDGYKVYMINIEAGEPIIIEGKGVEYFDCKVRYVGANEPAFANTIFFHVKADYVYASKKSLSVVSKNRVGEGLGKCA